MENVEKFLESTGMWMPENRAKYDFLLSPDVFPVRKEWEDQLVEFSRTLRNYFYEQASAFPPICKIDVMVDLQGDLKIAEVDGLNKRAFGYAILQRKIAMLFGHSMERFFPGSEDTLLRIVGDKALLVIVPGREKYYQFGFNIFVAALCDLGVDAVWHHEKASLQIIMAADPEKVVLLDCPTTGHVKLDSMLAASGCQVIIPNHEVFSSKDNLAGINHVSVPKTIVVDVVDSKLSLEYPFVLKTLNQSGSKGIFFWDDLPEEIPPGRYIAQEFVEGREFEFSYFDKEGRLRKNGGWQVRLIVTLNLLTSNVIDVDVTAVRGRLVHGQAESIQIAGVKE
jgi:hypothetical protein